jgi:hypothetical protein
MPVLTARSDASVERTANDAATPQPGTLQPGTLQPGTVPPAVPAAASPTSVAPIPIEAAPIEIGGPPGPEPTRFGDWEKAGRCIDF